MSATNRLTILMEDLPRIVSLDEYVKANVSQISKSDLQYLEIDRQNVVLSDGVKAVVIDYQSQQSGFTLGHRVLIVVKGRVAANVTFTSEANRFDDVVLDVEDYMTSLQLR